MRSATLPAVRVDPRLTQILVIGLGLAALVLATHPYTGVRHDGFIYAMEALRHLYPEALGGDLYFRYGSQGTYTVFPAGYALLIRHFGLEPAAWLVTRASGLAFAAAGFVLARQLMDRRLAWLALALLLAIPGKYGALDFFTYAEDFATPRPAAEALGLLAIALALEARVLASAVAAALALVLHPLMAAPAVLIVAALGGPPRGARWLATAVLGGLVATVAVAALHPLGPIRLIDPVWRAAIDWNVPYLLADHWTIMDWQRAGVPLATLAIALLVLPQSPPRRLAGIALAVGAAGVLLTVVHTWLAPVVLLIQGQGWRWVWIAKAVAVLLLVPVGRALWARGAGGRAILALLATAWIGLEESAFSLPALLCALAATLFEYRAGRPRPHLWIGTAAVAAGVAAAVVALVGIPPLAPLAAATFALWWATFEAGSAGLAAVAVLGAAALLGRELVVLERRAPPADLDAVTRALAPWQARIRPDQTVLFAENAMAAWIVLHRRSYLSPAALVFSRDTALEMRARHDRLTARVGKEADWFFFGRPLGEPPLTLATLRGACELPGLDFVVAPVSYPVPHLAGDAPPPFEGLYLYDCRDLRAAGGAGV